MSKCIVTTIALLMAAQGGKAQTSPIAAPPALPAKDQAPTAVASPSSSPTAWRIGPLDFSGMIDGYYSLGFNHPCGPTSMDFGISMTKPTSNQVELNMASVTVGYSPKPVGAWLEFRHDWSNQPAFNRGNETAMWKKQPTVLLGMVAIIGPKR
jgi:hypothetical protein